MNKLAKLCTTPKNLLTSQFIFLREKVEKNGGKLSFIHKFLVELQFSHEVYYIKINLLDNEFYLFSEKEAISYFKSFYELRSWIEDLLNKGDKKDE